MVNISLNFPKTTRYHIVAGMFSSFTFTMVSNLVKLSLINSNQTSAQGCSPYKIGTRPFSPISCSYVTVYNRLNVPQILTLLVKECAKEFQNVSFLLQAILNSILKVVSILILCCQKTELPFLNQNSQKCVVQRQNSVF